MGEMVEYQCQMSNGHLTLSEFRVRCATGME